jgi:glycolate oxidase FAD binding subunit
VVVTGAAVAVERPGTADELARLLYEAAAAGKAVTPVGGRRASGMGGPLERCDVELHTGRLDRIVEHSAADMVVTVEAGVTLESLQAQLSGSGQFLPLDPFNSPGHTIGGLLATGWTGPLRLRYGSARDFLIGIRVALPDGHLASAGGRVVKNVSGYDLMKLHHGALGSLGVIVAASFKVFPRPMRDLTLESRHASADEAWAEIDRALQMPLPPAALELFSDGRVLARFFGSPTAADRMAKDLGWPAVAESAWTEHSHRSPETWARVAVPAHRLREILRSLPQGSQWWASPGVGVAHWSVSSGADSIATVRARAEAAGGSLVLLGGPDDVKRAAGAWGAAPPTLEVMRRLKEAFDPGHVLNPGRFVV